jgi:phage FluMu protein gp41
VLRPFLRAYLAGDSGALSYLVPPGTRIAAAAGRFELIELGSITSVGAAAADERVVLVRVQARDVSSRVLYGLRYRVALVRRDRWYVADINGPGTARGSR